VLLGDQKHFDSDDKKLLKSITNQLDQLKHEVSMISLKVEDTKKNTSFIIGRAIEEHAHYEVFDP
jgi:hypothetical protein